MKYPQNDKMNYNYKCTREKKKKIYIYIYRHKSGSSKIFLNITLKREIMKEIQEEYI